MVASTKTKLSLSAWAKIFGMHPLHFNQVRLDTNLHCDQILFQHEWQTADHVSREEIARAIAEAESNIELYLGYRLTPTWEVDEWRETIKPFRPEMVSYNGHDVRGFLNTVRANWGYMISGGVEAKTLIDADAAITYSDEDGDGYFETATVTVSTTVQDINEICVFYPGRDGDDGWEIRPIEVVINAGTATITFRRELAVISSKLDAFDIEGAEAIGTEDEDFLEEVDVYRRYNDPQTQVTMMWEPPAGGLCGTCGGSGCSSCSYSVQTGCLLLRGDPRQSILAYHPAEWDEDELEFTSTSWSVSRQPDIVRLYYYAGWRNKSQRYVSRMSPEWERIVAYYAASLLDRPPCDCSKGNWAYWRQDLTLITGDEDGRPVFRDPSGLLGNSIQDNPFGSRRGAVNAWRHVSKMLRGQAVLV